MPRSLKRGKDAWWLSSRRVSRRRRCWGHFVCSQVQLEKNMIWLCTTVHHHFTLDMKLPLFRMCQCMHPPTIFVHTAAACLGLHCRWRSLMPCTETLVVISENQGIVYFSLKFESSTIPLRHRPNSFYWQSGREQYRYVWRHHEVFLWNDRVGLLVIHLPTGNLERNVWQSVRGVWFLLLLDKYACARY